MDVVVKDDVTEEDLRDRVRQEDDPLWVPLKGTAEK